MIILPLLLVLLQISEQTVLLRKDLSEYDLARCNDGTPASYLHQQDVRYANEHVLIYLEDGGHCGSVEACRERCREGSSKRDLCTAASQQVVERTDGIWSENPGVNPFANHFKASLHYCSSDNYAGTRGASRNTGNLYFHGRHILTAFLEDMSSRFGLARAASLTLIGSGSGARGVGYNCDYVASLLPGVPVKCIADSPDMTPWWVKSEECANRDYEKEEGEKIFWGRQDDESCIEENKSDVNSSELAHRCGVWSRYWSYIETPFFIVGSQFDPYSFADNPCIPDISDPEYEEYELAWRRGTAALYESILAGRQDRSWFVPDCRSHSYLYGELADSRFNKLTVPMLGSNKTMSLSASLRQWLEDSPLHAIDTVAGGNQECPGPAPLCRSECSASRSFDSYPSVRRRLLPPASIFPSGYDRQCCVDPWLHHPGSRGLGRDVLGAGHGGFGGHGARDGFGVGYASRGAVGERRNQLWKRLIYLNYLKRLYNKHKTEYAREYYGGYDDVYAGTHGIQGARDPVFIGDARAVHRTSTGGCTGGCTGVRRRIPCTVGCTGVRARVPDITDLLEDDYYDYYDDYDGSALLARIKNAVRLRKEDRKKKKSTDKSTKDNDEDLDELDYEDFSAFTEQIETSTK
ncbi:uncharacterized protein LOC111709817 [Eurytemora carolleeae]|uniref:uncharacterized protein LOC111709817 n=1 Tax=Eurytemora carolleeae TaxID=1294199 RepID=UPI000C7714AA|nr:uncharacterized protein LOC111709817 [Eurytemora carolleeae]XP_023339499.1 uncharacterized protein LOC111709817 [Eurytemora carolleeae]|eukprot:XP_023339498.1 uncharacterized protein LOC111709817 [Eurytemora affinis]